MVLDDVFGGGDLSKANPLRLCEPCPYMQLSYDWQACARSPNRVMLTSVMFGRVGRCSDGPSVTCQNADLTTDNASSISMPV